MPQSVLKDLDQHDFGKIEAEKKNYLAALILKHSHRLQIINEAYEALCTDLVARELPRVDIYNTLTSHGIN